MTFAPLTLTLALASATLKTTECNSHKHTRTHYSPIACTGSDNTRTCHTYMGIDNKTNTVSFTHTHTHTHALLCFQTDMYLYHYYDKTLY